MIKELDLILFGVFTVGAIIGVCSGFVRQIGSLAAVWCGVTFSGILSPFICDWIGSIVKIDSAILYLSSFILAFLLIAIGIKILAVLCVGFLSFLGGTLIDRLLGGVLGFVIAILMAGVAFNLMERFLPNQGWIEDKQESFLYPIVSETVPMFVPRLSDFLNSASDKITDFVGSSTE